MASARDAALKVLLRVETGQAFAAPALNTAFGRKWDARETALATEIVFGVLRRKPWLDRLLHSASARGLKKIDPVTRQVLRIGAYQIAFLDRIPARAAVSQAVSQIKRNNLGGLAGLVNAVLRRLSELEPDALDPSTGIDPGAVDDAACRLGLPTWLLEQLIASFGFDRAAAVARAFNEPSRRTMRANLLRTSRDDLCRALGHKADPGALTPWSLDVSCPDTARDLAEQGLAVHQDEGSQLAVLALDARPNQRILDMCAGRGGKTAALAMVTGGKAEITAADISSSKLDRLAFELAKQGVEARTICADMTATEIPLAPGFDRILVDAPCSGTGTLGRRPEIRWRLEQRSLDDFAAIQRRLLRSAARLLNPGGRLVYSVCSILPKEGAGHLKVFSDSHPGFHTVNEPDDLWPGAVPWRGGSVFVDPARTRTDGYQLLVLEKRD